MNYEIGLPSFDTWKTTEDGRYWSERVSDNDEFLISLYLDDLISLLKKHKELVKAKRELANTKRLVERYEQELGRG